jgi:predicted amidohydrolase YtcJ
MIESGINVSFSSDWPVSTPNVLQGMAVAVFRQGSPEMEIHNPDQAIALDQAIDAYTSTAARILVSNIDGTLSIGQPFDAVLIDCDLNEQDLDGFLSAKVLATYKAGKELLV